MKHFNSSFTLIAVLCILAVFAILVTPAWASGPFPDEPPNKRTPVHLRFDPATGIEITDESETTTTGGRIERSAQASGTGAGVNTTADKIAEGFKGTAPASNLPEFGSAAGGDSNKQTNASMFDPGTQNAKILLGIGGLICVGCAVFCFLKKPPLIRPALVFATAGAGLFTVMLMPWLLIPILVVIALVPLWPFIKAELERNISNETNRSMVAAVGALKAPSTQAIYERVKEEMAKHLLPEEVTHVREIKHLDAV